jgi:DNA-binding response OmpR family regulator
MKKVLVIDDDAMVRASIVHILEDGGYEVLAAADGIRGMAAFHSEHPDLVITDIVMPDQEGIQTINEIRSANPSAKIIAISGSGRFGQADFLKMARRLGAADTIAKPFDSDELLSRVKACLAQAADVATAHRAMLSQGDRQQAT